MARDDISGRGGKLEKPSSWHEDSELSSPGGRWTNDFFIVLHFVARASAMVLLFLSPYSNCRVNLKSSSTTSSSRSRRSPHRESCCCVIGLFATLSYMLCIKRKHEKVLCRGLVTEEMADCIERLHCITGCDANSGFYGKGKSSLPGSCCETNAAAT